MAGKYDKAIGTLAFRWVAIPAVGLSIWLYGCSLLQGTITYFDSTTYRNLTEVKPQVVFLYQTFTED